MAVIPTHKDWMSRTALGFSKPRSSELKLVDDALLNFARERNGTALQALDETWRGWKRTKVPSWQASERNKGGILVQLDEGIRERLGPLAGGVAMSPAEREALAYMERERRKAVHTLFVGRKVKFKGRQAVREAKKELESLDKAGRELLSATGVTSSSTKSAASSASSASRGSSSASGASGIVKSMGGGPLVDAKNAVDKMLADFFDVAAIDVIKPMLMSMFGMDIVATMIPIVGHLSGAGSVLVSWGKVGKAKYSEVTNRNHRAFVGGKDSDAERAFAKLERLMQGEVNTAIMTAGIKTTSFAAKSLLVLADGGVISGPAVGAAEALATVTQKIYDVATEYKETKRANLVLSDPRKLDWTLFDEYPLLAAYMLSCSTLSDVVNMSRVEFGGHGWMDDIEWMKRTHIDPMRESSRMLIEKSLFEVDGLMPLVARHDTIVKKAKMTFSTLKDPSGAVLKKF